MILCNSAGLLTDIFYISYPFFIRCTQRLTSDISSLVHHFSISSGVYIKEKQISEMKLMLIEFYEMAITRKLSIICKAFSENL